MELTIEALKQGEDAPISFADLIEVTETSFAIEQAIRTQRMASVAIRGEPTQAKDYR
jgi:hypothetical protein